MSNYFKVAGQIVRKSGVRRVFKSADNAHTIVYDDGHRIDIVAGDSDEWVLKGQLDYIFNSLNDRS